jgi:hypothetical protein
MVDDRLIKLSGDDLVNYLKIIVGYYKSIEVITLSTKYSCGRGRRQVVDKHWGKKKQKKRQLGTARGPNFTNGDCNWDYWRYLSKKINLELNIITYNNSI